MTTTDEERSNMAEHEHDGKHAPRDAEMATPRDEPAMHPTPGAPVVPDAEDPEIPAGAVPPGERAEGPTSPGGKLEAERASDDERQRGDR